MEDSAYSEAVWSELTDGRIVMMSPGPVLNYNGAAGNMFILFSHHPKWIS
ncbi:MAG: hypothetical protein LBR72_02135 [Oscillospiraceae bacterium]|jgi:hypothetical protein|nr:hypothetical protein [Oscillospiraceae bacterium]